MGLRIQFVLPVVLIGVGGLAGYLLGSLWVGFLVGLVFAAATAITMAELAVRRLRGLDEWLARTRVGPGAATPATPRRDEIDNVRATVLRTIAAERTLRRQEQEALLRQVRLLDQMSDGVMLADETGTIVYANVAAGSMVGGRNPVGRSFIAAVHDHELNEALRTCLATGREYRRTSELPGDDRVINWVMLRLTEGPPETLIVMRDVTELTRLQTLRRDFVANVSHELRTPISTIKILTETLLDLTAGQPAEQDFLHKIDAEVDSMTELVNDLLQLASLESGRAQLSLRELDPAELVAQVGERMLAIAERSDVHLEVVEGTGGATLVADERRIRQALVNLVHNAVSHTPPGGHVEIGWEYVDDGVRFVVSDTGTGIQRDDLERIWERFYKADRSRAEPGTGLGLAIVKHIVQAHGGDVEARSTVGEGSRFSITLPSTPGVARNVRVLAEGV